jgi:monooxygenase
MFGGATLIVDAEPVRVAESMVYKGSMISGVPNFAFAAGYTNASWTLKVDLTSTYVCRMISYLDAHHYREVRARRDPDVGEIPLLDFNSGYVTRALPDLPRQGDRLPWRLYQNYALDRAMLGGGQLADQALEFR